MAILIRNLILSLTLLRMQNTTEQNIHQYSQKLSTYHDEYIKDLPIELFKTIDEKRIKNEFYVLSTPLRSLVMPTLPKNTSSRFTASTKRAKTGTPTLEYVNNTPDR
jgi:hypothetical protein